MTDDQADAWSGSPPVPPDRGDFYDLRALLPDEQRALLTEVRRYLQCGHGRDRAMRLRGAPVQDLLARMLANTTASLTMCARLAELAQAGVMREEQ